MKSSKKLYKKKMQPPKYNPGALLAPLAGLAAAPATGAAATGALSAGTSAAIAGATSATAAGAATAVTGATSAAGTLPNLSALPTLNATLPSSSNVIPSIPAGTTLPPVPKGAVSTVNAASGASAKMPFSKNTSILGSSKDKGWTGQFAEDMATGNNVNAGNTVNTGNSFKGATQPKGASAQIKDMMEFDSPGDFLKLSQWPTMAITAIRQSALERQKSRTNQMNFANNMNANMDSGAYGDSGMMKKGGIMNSVAELTGQEYIVPRELIPYALEAGNAKLYASDKTEGAYSHETNPIQVYRAGGDIYVDEQGNTMKAGDLIIPEHKANSRAGIMSAINQNPYNNKADNGMPVPYTMEGFYRMLAGPQQIDKLPVKSYPLQGEDRLDNFAEANSAEDTFRYNIENPINTYLQRQLKTGVPYANAGNPSFNDSETHFTMADFNRMLGINEPSEGTFFPINFSGEKRSFGGIKPSTFKPTFTPNTKFGPLSGANNTGSFNPNKKLNLDASRPTSTINALIDKGPGTTSGDLDKNNRKFDKYDAQMLGMGAYALGTNMLNRFAPAEQIRSVELINPREMQFNPYFMQRQAKDIANQYYNTSQYTKSGSLSDNMATAANAMEASNQVITKTGQDIANLSQDYDIKNAQMYNQALADNAKSINQVNAYNAELLQKSNAMKSEMNYKNMQELGKSIIGAQELRNMDKSQKIQEEVIKYQLAVQKMQAESDEAFKKYNMEYQKWLNDPKKEAKNMPVIPTSPTMPSFTFPFK